MEDNFNQNQDQDSQSTSKAKMWLQDNLRVIISIAIVVAIAAGIYSYSNRTDYNMETLGEEEQSLLEDDLIAIDELTEEEGEEGTETSADQTEGSEEETTTSPEESVTPEETQETTDEGKGSAATSQETDNSFVESAQSGEGLTHLARRALDNYLEKNPDSELLPEQKIYIEDYLRKNVGFQEEVEVGTSVEFSKNLIKDGISQAKSLNENQIQNLNQYVNLVPSLT